MGAATVNQTRDVPEHAALFAVSQPEPPTFDPAAGSKGNDGLTVEVGAAGE